MVATTALGGIAYLADFAIGGSLGLTYGTGNALLGFYANCAIAWVTTVVADIAINKYLLGISPKEPEFRRAYLYAFLYRSSADHQPFG